MPDLSGSTVSERVRSVWTDLSEAQQRIGRVVVDEADELAFHDVRELAARTDSSAATVVRFCKAIGFAGFRDFQAALERELLHRLTPGGRLAATLDAVGAAGEDDADAGSATAVLRADLDNLERTLETLDTAAIDQATRLLDTCRVAYVLGFGLAVAPVLVLDYRLSRLGIPVISVTQRGRDVFNALLAMDRRDVLVAVAFYPLPTEVLKACEFARSRGAQVVALTDEPVMAVHEHADVTIRARQGALNKLTSMTAPVAVADALALAVAARRRNTAEKSYEDLAMLLGDIHGDIHGDTHAEEPRDGSGHGTGSA